MSDTLARLLECQHRALEELQASQRKRIAPFLRGDTHPHVASTPHSCATSSSTSVNALGLACVWHGFIPLAIASDAIFSLSTAGNREALRRYFETASASQPVPASPPHHSAAKGSSLSFQHLDEDPESKRQWNSAFDTASSPHGFDEVFTLHLQGSSSSSSGAGTTRANPQNLSLAHAARAECMEALRAATQKVVELARSARNAQQLHQGGSSESSLTAKRSGGTRHPSMPPSTPHHNDAAAPVSEGQGLPSSPRNREWRTGLPSAVSLSPSLLPSSRHPHLNPPTSSTGRAALPPVVRTHRILIAVRCPGDAPQSFSTTTSTASKTSSGTANAGMLNGGRHQRHFYPVADVLQLFLSDVVALFRRTRAQLDVLTRQQQLWAEAAVATTSARAVEKESSSNGVHRLHFAVLLLPEDDVCGGSKLAQRLMPSFGKDFMIQIFERDGEAFDTGALVPAHSPSPSTSSEPSRRLPLQREEGSSSAAPQAYDGRQILQVLSWWDPAAVLAWCAARHGSRSAGDDAVKPCDPIEAAAIAGSAWNRATAEHFAGFLLASRSLFFLRPSHLPLVRFLWRSLKEFPVLLPPQWLEGLQQLWASRRHLEDVVYALHTMLMPFTFTAELLRQTGSLRPSFPHTAPDSRRKREREEALGTNPTRDAKKAEPEASLRYVATLLKALHKTAEQLAVKTLTMPSSARAGHDEEGSTTDAAPATEEKNTAHGKQQTVDPGETTSSRAEELEAVAGADALQEMGTLEETETTSSATPPLDPTVLSNVTAVYFVLLYEDLIRGRTTRLLRLPLVLEALAHCPTPSAATTPTEPSDPVTQRQQHVAEVLKHCLPRYFLPFPGVEEASASHPLLQVARYGCAPPPIRPQLQRAALFAALPPLESLEQLQDARRYPVGERPKEQHTGTSDTDERENDTQRRHDVHDGFVGEPPGLWLPDTLPAAQRLSANNFYGPQLTRETRVLHLLTLFAAQQRATGSSSRHADGNGTRGLPLSHVQWAAQLSDEELMETLEVLQRSGLITIDSREVTAASTLNLSGISAENY